MPTRRIKCAICGTAYFSVVPESHILGHDLSPQDYESRYGPYVYSKLRGTALAQFTKKDRADFLIEAKAADVDSMRASSELRVLNAVAREKIVQSTQELVEYRRQKQKEDEEFLRSVMDELKQPWRMKTRSDGTPLENKEILQLGQFIMQSMKLTSDTFAHALNSVVSDNKSIVGKPFMNQIQGFTANFDQIPTEVKGLSPQDREKVRLMVESLGKLQQHLAGMPLEDRQKFLAAIDRQSQVVIQESAADERRKEGTDIISTGEKAGNLHKGV